MRFLNIKKNKKYQKLNNEIKKKINNWETIFEKLYEISVREFIELEKIYTYNYIIYLNFLL